MFVGCVARHGASRSVTATGSASVLSGGRGFDVDGILAPTLVRPVGRDAARPHRRGPDDESVIRPATRGEGGGSCD